VVRTLRARRRPASQPLPLSETGAWKLLWRASPPGSADNGSKKAEGA
jgi:hypothetical protein